MDVLALRDALSAAVATHGVVGTWHALAGPAFAHLTAAADDPAHRDVARRLLGQALRDALAAVPRPAVGTPVRVLLVAADTRRDAVAVDAVAAALAERGIAAANLGSGPAPDVLADAVARSRPAVVVVWSHARNPAPDQLATTVVLAGRDRPPDPAGAVVAPTLAEVVAAVVGLTA